MSSTAEQDLAALADEELVRACSLSWLQLCKVTPWGDTYEGFTAAGRAVLVERNYLWADHPGGDVMVEVVVAQNAVLYDEGARRSARIPATR